MADSLLTRHSGALAMSVLAHGFDPATTKRGTGLTNMADRLDALGGTIHLHSQPGTGTTLRGTIPVPAPLPA